MEYTPTSSVTAVPHLEAGRAMAYGLPSIKIDGNDVEVGYSTARTALELAANGGGPSLIESETYWAEFPPGGAGGV